jgi:osmotically-inducible protein OsmY
MNTVVSPRARVDVSDPDPIVRRVEDALQTCGYRDLFGLQCECNEGVITLVGHVGSYFLKQMAQTVVGRVEGVTRINNQLQVS